MMLVSINICFSGENHNTQTDKRGKVVHDMWLMKSQIVYDDLQLVEGTISRLYEVPLDSEFIQKIASVKQRK
ncbi:hypothetical protein ACLOJK_010986 [Asimina triloba]